MRGSRLEWRPLVLVDWGDPSPMVRRHVVEALEFIGGDASPALGPLRERLGDPDPEVHRAAERAIEAILKTAPLSGD